MDLVIARPEGLYCPPGDFYIDPWRPVQRAVITHGHSDHARPGSAHYLAATSGAGVLRHRLGADIALDTLAYGETVVHHGVKLSLHPAGHVLGSAQVRLEVGGEVWVVSRATTKWRPTAPVRHLSRCHAGGCFAPAGNACVGGHQRRGCQTYCTAHGWLHQFGGAAWRTGSGRPWWVAPRLSFRPRGLPSLCRRATHPSLLGSDDGW